jgi:hypothetical protein
VRPLAPGLLAIAIGLGAAPAGADIVKMEALGAAPIRRDEPHREPPRDAAMRAAISNAVTRAALGFMPNLDPAEADSVLREVLGDEPFDYATRYIILDDRGERRAVFTDDPEAETEYVVMVEVHVDLDRIRQRLTGSGLLDRPSGEPRRFHLRLEIVDLVDFEAYDAVRRTLIDEIGVRSALPVEMERGRAVLAVDGERTASELLQALSRAAPEGVRITPLDASGDRLTVRVTLEGAPGAREGPGDPGAPGPEAPARLTP